MAEKGARPEAKPMTGYSTYPHSPASVRKLHTDNTFLHKCRDQQAFFYLQCREQQSIQQSIMQSIMHDEHSTPIGLGKAWN